MPLISFHGTADPIVPYVGGPSATFDLPSPPCPIGSPCGPAAAAVTPPRHRCRCGEVSGVQYTGCRDGADVIFYTIAGGGHAWPGGEPLPSFIVGHTTQDIDATAVMWEFFSQHPLQQTPGREGNRGLADAARAVADYRCLRMRRTEKGCLARRGAASAQGRFAGRENNETCVGYVRKAVHSPLPKVGGAWRPSPRVPGCVARSDQTREPGALAR